jgi:hypothetical protein
MVNGIIRGVKSALMSVLRNFADLLNKFFGRKSSAASEKTNPFTYVAPVIASPSLNDQSGYYLCPTSLHEEAEERIIAVPSNIAKAVANCSLKGRIDLAEAIFRGFGYGETRVILDQTNIKAYTQLGVAYIDTLQYGRL